jgi:chromosome segregation ATPase
METTGTRRQQLRELQEDLDSLTHEYQSLQIRLYNRWSQVQWLKVQGGTKTVTSASLATEIETMRARQVVLREAIRELKARLRALQSTR